MEDVLRQEKMSNASPAGPQSARPRIRRITILTSIYMLLAIILVVQFFPLAWAFLTSFMTPAETTSIPATIVPLHPTFSSYFESLEGDIRQYYSNSTTVSTISTIVTIILATLAAYAFARLRFRFKTALLLFVLSLSLFPPLVQVIPVYQILQKFHLIGTLAALILPYTVSGLPLAVLVLIAIFQDIPSDTEEAAMVDGLTRWGAFLRIFLPMVMPGLFTAIVIIFVSDWNEYLFALNYTTPNTSTLPVGLVSTSQTEFTTQFGILSAAIIISVIPLIVRILLMERRFVSGLTAGTLK